MSAQTTTVTQPAGGPATTVRGWLAAVVAVLAIAVVGLAVPGQASRQNP